MKGITLVEIKKLVKGHELFVDTVYNNFIHLAEVEKLKHTYNEITRLVGSDNFMGLMLYKNGIMIGYLLGEFMNLQDGRPIYYITYIYIASKYRSSGFGSRLMASLTERAKKMNLRCITLTCDTEDKKVYDFYALRGFMPDPLLRTYDRHDVLSLYL